MKWWKQKDEKNKTADPNAHYRETPKSNPELLRRRRAVEDILERKRERELYGDIIEEALLEEA